MGKLKNSKLQGVMIKPGVVQIVKRCSKMSKAYVPPSGMEKVATGMELLRSGI